MTAPNPRPHRKALDPDKENSGIEGEADGGAAPPPASIGVPLHEMQQQLWERLAADARVNPPAPSDAKQKIERVVAFASRLAGPILFVAALAGLIALVF